MIGFSFYCGVSSYCVYSYSVSCDVYVIGICYSLILSVFCVIESLVWCTLFGRVYFLFLVSQCGWGLRLVGVMCVGGNGLDRVVW